MDKITDRLFEVFYGMRDFPEVLRPHTDYGSRFRNHVDDIVAANTYPDTQLLLNAGVREDIMYFLNRGDARGYTYDEESGKQITLFLWPELSFVVAPTSFYQQMPSKIFIEVLSGSQLISATYADMVDTFAKFPEGEILTRSVSLQQNEILEQRLIDSKNLAPWARYKKLLKEYPRIRQKWPQHVIASFIGIAPEYLSRLKGS